MSTLRLILLYFLLASISCGTAQHRESGCADSISLNENEMPLRDYDERAGKGALLLTRFSSLEDFKTAVNVQYVKGKKGSFLSKQIQPEVRLTYRSGGHEVTSTLKAGISQSDFLAVRNGSIWGKIGLGLRCPFALLNKKDLSCIENLGRRRPPVFGKGDAAFYDLAETMVHHIREEDFLDLSCDDISEKGYLNTFNHVTAQAMMTSIFSERIADFVADVHELYNMPELVTGNFTEKQMADFENGPVDNYIDMINNEWGQELGKILREKYSISRKTSWTPELLTNYLNDIQSYYSWAFQIGFTPFRDSDEIMIQFSWKINTVLAMP